MRPPRLFFLFPILLLVFLPLHARPKHLIVLGKLTELSSPDAGSTWGLQLNPVITVDGRQISVLQLRTSHPQKLESLQDAFVQAKGTLIVGGADAPHDIPILQLSSLHAVKYNNPDKDKPKSSVWTSVVNFFSPSPI